MRLYVGCGITQVVSVIGHDQPTGQTSFSTEVKIKFAVVVQNMDLTQRSCK